MATSICSCCNLKGCQVGRLFFPPLCHNTPDQCEQWQAGVIQDRMMVHGMLFEARDTDAHFYGPVLAHGPDSDLAKANEARARELHNKMLATKEGHAMPHIEFRTDLFGIENSSGYCGTSFAACDWHVGELVTAYCYGQGPVAAEQAREGEMLLWAFRLGWISHFTIKTTRGLVRCSEDELPLVGARVMVGTSVPELPKGVSPQHRAWADRIHDHIHAPPSAKRPRVKSEAER